MNIGNKIKDLRTEKGLTQKELADKLFVTPQAISRYERDEVEPGLNTILQLAELFEVSVDYLFDKETNPEDKKKESDELIQQSNTTSTQSFTDSNGLYNNTSSISIQNDNGSYSSGQYRRKSISTSKNKYKNHSMKIAIKIFMILETISNAFIYAFLTLPLYIMEVLYPHGPADNTLLVYIIYLIIYCAINLGITIGSFLYVHNKAYKKNASWYAWAIISLLRGMLVTSILMFAINPRDIKN